jgi:hypothetical protein
MQQLILIGCIWIRRIDFAFDKQSRYPIKHFAVALALDAGNKLP